VLADAEFHGWSGRSIISAGAVIFVTGSGILLLSGSRVRSRWPNSNTTAKFIIGTPCDRNRRDVALSQEFFP
jgi:hypothetical protein